MSARRATEVFLESFNAIDGRLRKLSRAGRQVPFTQVLRFARDRDPSLVPVFDQLQVFNQLRNVIVHDGADLAEPVEATLKAMAAIRAQLEAPPRLDSLFVRNTVTCGPSDPIRKVAQLMATEDFSQLPVYNDRGLLVGMITTAAIARWLGAHSEAASAELSAPTSEVMACEEYPRAYLVLRKDETVGRALAAFKASADRGEPLYAIVLTDNGRHTSPPLGLITLFDIPKLWFLAGDSRPH